MAETKRSIYACFTAAVLFGLCIPLQSIHGKIQPSSVTKHNQKNEASPTTRNCSDPNNSYLPPTATNTTERLNDLRREMENHELQGYIIPSSDPHLSEYVALRDRKRAWMTGFSGSAGTAVVTKNKAALWTDGRYFLQAEQQLDCNWILMKIGEPEVPSIDEWLIDELNNGSSVGANPFLFSIDQWKGHEEALFSSDITMEEAIPDLIDLIWEDRPPSSSTSLLIHQLKYAGQDWKIKLANARNEMLKVEADMLLLTILDEIAWFFNLRGSDVPYTPVFSSYVIITESDVMLYANVTLFENDDVRTHLNGTNCNGDSSCVIVFPYEQARPDLGVLASDADVKAWLPSDGTSFGMYSVVNEEQQISVSSPLKLTKALKNPTEVEAMRKAHVYDAVALCEYLQWLEVNVPLGGVSEMSGAEVLKDFRLAQETNQGLSFGSLTASGPNGAIIHYGVSEETNRMLSVNEMYLIDSGGQYFGGTTDVTRSMHFGKPTPKEKEAFTRALMGLIDVQRSIFPSSTIGHDLDVLARRHLYDVGLDYRHGTGHGIGLFLAVHEYPPGFGTSASENYDLQPGMFVSVEPGYYETGAFGLRHENINTVVEKKTTYQFEDYKFLTFEPVTLVPFQKKMINATLMDDRQLEYLNQYHKNVNDIIGAEAERQGKPQLKTWIEEATSLIVRSGSESRSFPSLVMTSSLAIISYTFSAL